MGKAQGKEKAVEALLEFIFIRIIEIEMKNEKKSMIYAIICFKLKGHKTWRLSFDLHGVDETQITERKTIFVDRITGGIVIK